MTTATPYDAFDFLEHVVGRALRGQNGHGQRTTNPASSPAAACAPAPASAETQTRLIRMDVRETELAYLATAELPGVSKDRVEVVIEGKLVSLQAEILPPQVPEGQTERNLMDERFYGKLSRRIQLPLEIDDALAEARFVDGILYLTLPKKKLVGVRKLDIV